LILNNVATNLIQQLITMEPIELNLKDNRTDRQRGNNRRVYSAIKENDQNVFHENINKEKYKRFLEEKGLTKEEFWKRTRECDNCADLASMYLAKNASRQGSKDEAEQLRTCNIIAENCGISIKTLTATELRPTKDGRWRGSIVSKDEMKEKRNSKG